MNSKKIIILTLLVCVSFVYSQKMPNIDYLRFGYDIYKGNPSPSKGTDPGFRTRPIFDFVYGAKILTADGRYEIPDDVSIASEEVCNLDLSTETITGEQSYKNSLSQSVTVEGGYAGASFSASVDYNRVKESTNTNSDIYLTSQGLCSVYRADLNPLALPKLSSGFIRSVQSLPDEYDHKKYRKFIELFGTHFFTNVKMGSRFGYISKISRNGWTKLESQGIKVSAAASYKGLFEAGVKSVTDVQKSEAEKFNQEKESWSQFSFGSRPPADSSVNSWAQKTFDQPMPIAYSIDSMSVLFDDDLLVGVSNIKKKTANFERALNEYCPYLKSQGLVQSCSEPTADKPLPKILNSCRLCAKTCGGAFPTESGTISADANWPKWSFTYDGQCGGVPANRDVAGGVKLCCQEEDDNREGTCRLCTRCGGLFNFNGGNIMSDQNWSNWIRAYDNSCNADARQRNNPSDGIQLCCKGKPLCNFCSSCGGNYPQETGVVSVDQNWPNFFRGKSDSCGGDNRVVGYNMGMKLCCQNMGNKL